MTLAGNTDFHCGSIDTNFDPPQFPLDSTFKATLQLQLSDIISSQDNNKKS
jgi:hypothetical protein